MPAQVANEIAVDPHSTIAGDMKTSATSAPPVGVDNQKEETEGDFDFTEEEKIRIAFNRGIGNPNRDISGEPHSLYLTADKKYFKYDGPAGTVWFKRNLTAPECSKSLVDGELFGNHMAFERLKNEAAALKFIGENTNIPIPVVRAAFEDNGRFYLFTDEVKGIQMSCLPEEQKPLVFKEIETHIATLRGFKSNQMGGLSGDVCLPWRVGYGVPKFEGINLRPSDQEEFVLCHNDLGQSNIFVDPDTLKVNGIIDWEFAGYYPPEFEGGFYKRKGPSCAMEGEPNDETLREMLEKWIVRDA